MLYDDWDELDDALPFTRPELWQTMLENDDIEAELLIYDHETGKELARVELVYPIYLATTEVDSLVISTVTNWGNKNGFTYNELGWEWL